MSAPEVTGAPTQGSPAGNQARPRGNAFVNWFLLRDELSQARAKEAGVTALQRDYVRRAKLAFELAEFALAPGSVLRSGSGAPLASDLFRQSIYWALLSRRSDSAPASPEAVWDASDSALLASAAADDAELREVSAAVRASFVDFAGAQPDGQHAAAERLQRAASRLITNVQSAEWQLEWAKLKRLLRVLLLIVVIVVPAAVGINAALTKPDLAKGKPWRTSSVEMVCHPEKSECGGHTTDIIFHTKNEDNPWFEYDFGTPLAFSSLTIRNRTDYGLELAVPLVVEVSNDGVKYKEIARRPDSFVTWKPSFATQHARYLRLRVLNKTYFHLEAVKVHP